MPPVLTRDEHGTYESDWVRYAGELLQRAGHLARWAPRTPRAVGSTRTP